MSPPNWPTDSRIDVMAESELTLEYLSLKIAESLLLFLPEALLPAVFLLSLRDGLRVLPLETGKLTCFCRTELAAEGGLRAPTELAAIWTGEDEGN